MLRHLLLITLPILLSSCERPFTSNSLIDNQSSQTLIFPDINTNTGLDTLRVPPGNIDTLHSSTDETARVPEPIPCGSISQLDTILVSDGSWVTLDFDDTANWLLYEFQENDFQSCVIVVTDDDLQ